MELIANSCGKREDQEGPEEPASRFGCSAHRSPFARVRQDGVLDAEDGGSGHLRWERLRSVLSGEKRAGSCRSLGSSPSCNVGCGRITRKTPWSVRAERPCTRVRKVCILGNEPVSRVFPVGATKEMAGGCLAVVLRGDRGHEQDEEVVERVRRFHDGRRCCGRRREQCVLDREHEDGGDGRGWPVDQEPPVQGGVHLRRSSEQHGLDPCP